jgi:hypothetical protein
MNCHAAYPHVCNAFLISSTVPISTHFHVPGFKCASTPLIYRTTWSPTSSHVDASSTLISLSHRPINPASNRYHNTSLAPNIHLNTSGWKEVRSHQPCAALHSSAHGRALPGSAVFGPFGALCFFPLSRLSTNQMEGLSQITSPI